ncbi:aminoacyl tRNA synthase complex-interacting multifunctional protein 1 [Leguminivora glycinivorella]|uniref:aminoacyl tRNA synthase complex-interacting multifunctional protein 1 n=1 Tax=Leguminivora glycinivorella TaxID=1035111 RepID=UPI00200D3075|nr:aminoacyl tRNA synthase complex-interacting multifunctional protein 1 [Leguminivora glycinivorella]
MINLFFRRIMSQNIVCKILNNAETAEKRLAELKTKLEEIRKIKVEEKIRELTQENGILAAKVEKTKLELIRLETLNGKKQIPIPNRASSTVKLDTLPVQPESEPAPKKEKKEKDASKKAKPAAPPAADSPVTVSKLDFRIGKIIEINKHPDADSLYVEQIDCGEEKPRTVVSGLVNHVPINEMKDRIVMVLCNLKPVKMRGVTSEAMVMCASSPGKVEVLIPPSGAVPGDLVSCEGYPREPEAQLNPKKKIFETCAPDLKTNADKVACYKETPLVVPGKGPVIAATLKDVHVK